MQSRHPLQAVKVLAMCVLVLVSEAYCVVLINIHVFRFGKLSP